MSKANSSIKYVNLTKHVVRVIRNKTLREFQPSGKILRIPRIIKGVGYEDGIETVLARYEKAKLPPRKNGTAYIVSTIVLEYIKRHHPDRDDFRAPDTGSGGIIRTPTGKVYAVRRWVKSGTITAKDTP
jgi:hypothetical protein